MALLALVAPLILSSCYGYQVIGANVYYNYFSEASGQHSVLVEGADATTFSTTEVDGTVFGRDKNNLYATFNKVDHIDPSTFRVLTKVKWRLSDTLFRTFYADKNHVYGPGLKLIENVDPRTFQVIDSDWQRDKDFFVNYGTSFQPVDTKTFEIIDDIWARDSRSFYYAGRPLLEADLVSFQRNFYGRSFSRDKTQVFYGSDVVADADPETFEQRPGTGYYQDKDHIFDLESKTYKNR